MSRLKRQTPQIKEGLQVAFEELTQEQRDLLKWESPDGMFDTRVEIRDPRTGILLKYQPYRYIADAKVGTYIIRRDDKGIERRYGTNGRPLDEAHK
jgi:hypothetical protein